MLEKIKVPLNLDQFIKSLTVINESRINLHFLYEILCLNIDLRNPIFSSIDCESNSTLSYKILSIVSKINLAFDHEKIEFQKIINFLKPQLKETLHLIDYLEIFLKNDRPSQRYCIKIFDLVFSLCDIPAHNYKNWPINFQNFLDVLIKFKSIGKIEEDIIKHFVNDLKSINISDENYWLNIIKKLFELSFIHPNYPVHLSAFVIILNIKFQQTIPLESIKRFKCYKKPIFEKFLCDLCEFTLKNLIIADNDKNIQHMDFFFLDAGWICMS